MQSEKGVSLKLSKSLHFKMQQHIIDDGYGMRGKTKWLIEAIQSFLQFPNYQDFVDIADEVGDLETSISIRMPLSLYQNLEKALITVRKKFPEMEGVKSKLIRASILQRILRGI